MKEKKFVGIPFVTFKLFRFEIRRIYQRHAETAYGGVGLAKGNDFEDGDMDTSRECIRIPVEQFNAFIGSHPCRFLVNDTIRICTVTQMAYLANVEPKAEDVFAEASAMLVGAR